MSICSAEDWVDVTSEEPDDLAAAKLAFATLHEKYVAWKLVNSHRPFDKNVVSILGLTSSGKSSFVNHFFGVHVKRVAQCEIDTHFTLVETVPEAEFSRLVSGYQRQSQATIDSAPAVSLATASDPRRNVAYVILDVAATLARYEQFESFSAVFRKHHLIESVLINEAYLPATSPQEGGKSGEGAIDIRKRTILIDSPGFTAETDVSRLEGNLKVLQFVYQLSQLTLFFVPADALSLVAGQIHLLELSLIYSFHGAETVERVLDHTKKHLGPSSLFSVTNLYSIITQQLGLGWGSSAEGQSAAVAASSYVGSSHWEKVRFVLTKMDRVQEPDKRPGAGQEAAFYELGIMLASNLKSMRAPVFGQCLAIALPGHQPACGLSSTRDLDLILSEISALNLYSSYVERLEASIQSMCDELRQALARGIWGYLGHSDSALVERLYRESKARSVARLNGNLEGAPAAFGMENSTPSTVSTLLSYTSGYLR